MAKNVIVVGTQWGDEGKGKIVDWLSARADVVVRFQGGHNAGHTLVVGDQDLNVLAGHTKSSKHRKAEDMQSAGHPIRIIGESSFKSLVAGSKAS